MIRFGIIGTNWISEAFIKAAKHTGEFALTAVYSRNDKTAKHFAAKYGALHIFTDIHAFAVSETFDAVYIASPNSLHSEQAMLCMGEGKHVICEKPIASNTYELQEMIEAAAANNVVLMEALKTTLLPNFLAIQQHIHKIGKIRRYTASYCQYSSRYDKYKEGIVLNAFKPELSNGSLMDIGIYTIYPMVALFGRPVDIQANAYMLDSGVDGQGSILFKYPDMDAAVTYSKIANSYLPSEIQGEDGTIIIDKIHTPEKVVIKYKDGYEEDISIPQKEDSMFYEADEFISLIKSGKRESSINTHSVSMTTLEIIETARKQFGLIYPSDKK
jgi:predicted dehydrogenase